MTIFVYVLNFHKYKIDISVFYVYLPRKFFLYSKIDVAKINKGVK